MVPQATVEAAGEVCQEGPLYGQVQPVEQGGILGVQYAVPDQFDQVLVQVLQSVLRRTSKPYWLLLVSPENEEDDCGLPVEGLYCRYS